jgi:YVTN family beta-propeller protein
MSTRLLSLAAVVPLALAAACRSSNPPPPDTDSPPIDARGPAGARRDSIRRNRVIENNRPDVGPRAGVLVVANQQAGSATVLDAATFKTIATVPVGNGPHEVAISPDGRWAVVTLYGDATAGNSLAVIDLAAETPSVVRTISLGQYSRPHGAAFVRAGAKLVVTSETAQRLLLVDFVNGRVDTALATNGRGSHLVTVQRDGRRAWTGNIADGTVTEYDLETLATGRTYPVAPDDEAIAATPGGVQLWVGSNSAKTVTVVNSADAKIVGTVGGMGRPYRVGVARTGRVAVVSDPDSNRVLLFDIYTRKELARVDLAREKGVGAPAAKAGPEGIAFDPIADLAYVTLHGTNQVVAIDLRGYKVLGFGATGTGPDGIGYSPLVRR